ncbi:MAG: fatty acid desaturase family protein [Micropepsaceae bacterium]
MTLAAAQFLTPDELASLRRRSDFRGLWCVSHAWLVIFGAMAALAWFPNPMVWAVGIVLVGARQLGLAILMHDAAHGVLTRDRKLNEFLGQYVCAWPMISDLHFYRAYHLQHHRHTQQKEDPDLSLSAPFPITRDSFRRKLIRDLTGQTTFKQRVGQFQSAFTVKGGTALDGFKNGLERLGGPIAVNLALFAVLAALGYWWLFFALWVAPFFIWFPMITRIRNIAEHAVVPDNNDDFRNARTTKANLLWRACVAPYWVNYHVEHHLLMFIPCYNLPAFHKLLLRKGFGPRMEIQPDYITVLKLATSRIPGAKPAIRDLTAQSDTGAKIGAAFNTSLRSRNPD